MDRPDLPRVKTTKRPTLLNREAGMWGYGMTIVGSIAALPFMFGQMMRTGRVPMAANVIVWGSTAAGVLIGGIQGKQRQERELVEGKVVQNPTIWNSGFFSGAIVGSLIQVPLNMALHAGHVSPNLAAAISLPVSLGAVYTGMKLRKNEMLRDFDQAVGLRQQEIGALKEKIHTLEKTTPAPGHSYKNSVSEEESAELAAKQEKPVNHTERSAATDAVAAPDR